jgi:hypothetical protein
MKNSDMPAMPVFDSSGCPSLYGDDGAEAKGLTKREVMAMHMMQGLNANPKVDMNEHDMAALSVICADALLAALEEKQ